ncbi:MAG: TatD family hydrolase [Sandaracinaceae bacterium]
MFDSHCHLAFDALHADLAGVARRAREAGVERVLVPGVRGAPVTPPVEGIAISHAVGVHPLAAHEPLDVDALSAAVAGAVAIGELGWDAGVEASRDTQDGVADAQIELARQLDLPVILHVVGAHGHAIERLARHGGLSGVVHAYSGSAELVARYAALGLHVSIGPSILRESARKPREAARAVPADRLLIETDAPDQAPEPADVLRVARAVADARGEDLDALASRSFENACNLFALG